MNVFAAAGQTQTNNLRKVCVNLRPIPPLLLCEAPSTYRTQHLPPESDLWRLWEGQRFPKRALVTVDGRPLRVVFRGQPGRGPGPDFRGAILSAPEGLLQGDVELHVRTSDFRRHGHHLDPAYAGVVLHVVLFHDEVGDTLLPGGGTAPVLALGGPRLAAWLEQAPRWGEPCRSAVERLGLERVARTLERLGGMRFRQKVAALRSRLAAGELPDEVLWSGLLEGLGYGSERAAFRRLAGDVPWVVLRRRLLNIEERARPDEALAVIARVCGPPEMHGGVRPGNRPERRLKGVAALAARFAGPGLSASLIGPLAEDGDAGGAILRALTVKGLIGRARAIELAANAVLPVAAALCGDAGTRQAEEVFAGLPLPARYGAVRHLHEAASGIRIDARRQQGMLYLQKQYCTQGGCGKCPLS